MKVKKSEIKTCKIAYLYHDGHFVMVHKKRDKDVGEVSWITIYQDIGIRCDFEKGRLIIKKEVLPFLMVCDQVRVIFKSLDNGSSNTRKMGIAVETIMLHSYIGEWIISNFPDVISSDIYHNNNDSGFFNPKQLYWSDMPVKKIYKNNP